MSDSGPGIPPAERARIFERFHRMSVGAVRGDAGGRSGGSGLGLAICKAIVEAHEGHIAVESAEGAGARFVVTLPGVPRAGHAMQDRGISSSGASSRVLHADDNDTGVLDTVNRDVA